MPLAAVQLALCVFPQKDWTKGQMTSECTQGHVLFIDWRSAATHICTHSWLLSHTLEEAATEGRRGGWGEGNGGGKLGARGIRAMRRPVRAHAQLGTIAAFRQVPNLLRTGSPAHRGAHNGLLIERQRNSSALVIMAQLSAPNTRAERE